ncbi:MAG: hypothetical protein ACRBDI_03245 [Alphaproteobacteria bacterium]
MAVTNIYSLLNQGVSYRTFQNYSIGQNLVSKATQLVNDLEHINTAKKSPLTPIKTDLEKKVEAKLDELIAGSIKEIIELRKSLGITQAAGQNKPLDDLFKTIKGSVFNRSI